MTKIPSFKTLLRLTTYAAFGLTPVLVSGQTALAQPGDDPQVSDTGFEEVVVTARKRSENIQKVPVAVTAVSGEQLREQMITQVSNLQRLAPGLNIQQGIDDPQSIILTLRGRKQIDATLGVDAAVGVNVDGFYVPRSVGMAGALLDLERVEILRGPQGTLYGRNTTGGAIGIFTNDPTHEWFGSIDVTAGDYGTWSALGIANIPIADNLDARFVVQHGGHGGYDHTTSGTPLGDARNAYYRGKLRWTGGDWKAVLSAHYENDRSGANRPFIPALNPANFEGNGLPEGGFLTLAAMAELGVSEPEAVALLKSWTAQKSPWYTLDNTRGPAVVSRVKKWDIGLNISGDLTDTLQFRSLTSIQRLWQDNQGGPQFPIFLFKQHPHSSETYYSQEFQLLGSTPRLNWVVGAYGAMENGKNGQTIFFLPSIFGTGAAETDSILRYSSLAAFAQATWEFIPDWHVTVGGRYSSDSRHVEARGVAVDLLDPTIRDCLVPAPGAGSIPPGPSQCPRTFKAQFAKPTWLVSLDHQLTSNILVYAKIATGYRSGGLNADQGAFVEEAFSPFRPETNLEYEAGLKTELFDGRVRLNGAVYWDEYSNLQEKTTTLGANNAFVTLVTSASKSRVRGVEVEADVNVGWGLTMHAATAFTEARYISFVDALGDHSDRPFDIPKWTVNASANYTRPIGIGEVSLQVDYAWKSSFNAIPYARFAETVIQPAYGLLNARLNVHLDAWNADIAVFGQNLTDEEYFDQGYNVAAAGAGFDFTHLYVGGPPRTFGIQLVKKFGE